jgi:hypothetical protein
VFRFIQQHDRRNRGWCRRSILEFLQLRLLGKTEEAFGPFQFFGQGLQPGEKTFPV